MKRNKNHENQGKVWDDILAQRKAGNKDIIGMMLESHLHEGNQKLTTNLDDLAYGVSITDKCINWQTTDELLKRALK